MRKTPVSGLEDYLTDPAEVKIRVKKQKSEMSRTLMSQMTEKRIRKNVMQNTQLESDQ